MDRAEYIVRHVGSALLGIPIAAVVSLCSKLLWPLMAVPVFLAVVATWIASGISMMLREDREGVTEGWMSFATAKSKTRFWPGAPDQTSRSRWLEYICNNITSSMFGLVVAVMIAGTVRRLLGGGEWYVFFVVLAVWMLGTIKMIIRDYRVSRDLAEGAGVVKARLWQSAMKNRNS